LGLQHDDWDLEEDAKALHFLQVLSFCETLAFSFEQQRENYRVILELKIAIV